MGKDYFQHDDLAYGNKVYVKFEVHHLLGFLKYKNIFANTNVPNETEEVFALKEVTSTMP